MIVEDPLPMWTEASVIIVPESKCWYTTPQSVAPVLMVVLTYINPPIVQSKVFPLVGFGITEFAGEHPV